METESFELARNQSLENYKERMRMELWMKVYLENKCHYRRDSADKAVYQ